MVTVSVSPMRQGRGSVKESGQVGVIEDEWK